MGFCIIRTNLWNTKRYGVDDVALSFVCLFGGGGWVVATS